MKRLKSILLIDDDAVTNFLHESLIQEFNVTDNIKVIENGEDAFQYLKQFYLEGKCPELIFLDLNMPITNGFEFLESYKLLDSIRDDSVIIILSSSELDGDKVVADSFGVNDFIVKPLTTEKLRDVFERHFNFTFADEQ